MFTGNVEREMSKSLMVETYEKDSPKHGHGFSVKRLVMPVLYFVKSGPDESHMWDVVRFKRLKDARQFASELPLTPGGGARPFAIERYEYKQDEVYGDIVSISEVRR